MSILRTQNTEILLQFVQAIKEDATRDASALALIRPDGSVLQVSESNGDVLSEQIVTTDRARRQKEKRSA
jgi:hypothetical protein